MKKTFHGNADEVTDALKAEGVRHVVSPGRRAPMHCMHKDCADDIIRSGAKLVLLIGSVNGPESELYDPVHNPLTIDQQKEQFRHALPGVDYEVVTLEDYVTDADWMAGFVDALKSAGLYENAAVHFRAKAADATKLDKKVNKPLSQYTDVFAENGLTVWQSYNTNPADDLISATDIRYYDLNALTEKQRAVISAPDYIVGIARAARAANPDRDLLEQYNIPLTVYDLAFDRMRNEIGLTTADIIKAAEKKGDVTLKSLEDAALSLVRERNAAHANPANNVTPFPAGKKPLLVIGSSVSTENAEILTNSGIFEPAGASMGKFQCDESFVELFYGQEDRFEENAEKIMGADAYIIQSTAEPVGDHIQHLYKAIHTLKRYGAANVTVIAPEIADLRQDRPFPKRFVSVGAELMATLLKASGADKVVTFTPHSQGAIAPFKQAFGDDFIAISANEIFAGYLCHKFGAAAARELVCGAPDGAEKLKDEGQRRARDLSSMLRGEFNDSAMFKISKTHTGVNQTAIVGFEGDVAGRDCVIIDDMIDGGGTMLNAARLLKSRGAKSVTCMVTHPLLIGNGSTALERLMTAKEGGAYAIDNLVMTDSVPEAADKIAAFAKQYPDLAKKVDMIHLGNAILSFVKEDQRQKKAAKAAPALKVG